MKNFTFLTRTLIKELDIFKRKGTGALLTDFAILLGAYVTDISRYARNKHGLYFTKTIINKYCTEGVYNDFTYTLYTDTLDAAARPICFLHDDTMNLKYLDDMTLDDMTFEYGFYPQQAASMILQKILELAFRHNKMRETGNTFTINGAYMEDGYGRYLPVALSEYEYKGEFYVRVNANVFGKLLLSNGCLCKRGQNVWVRVEPVKWLIDKNTNIAISDKLLFAGVPFYDVDFEKTTIKKFMDSYFENDLCQRQNKEMSNRGLDASLKDDCLINDVVLDLIMETVEIIDGIDLDYKDKKFFYKKLKKLGEEYVSEVNEYRESLTYSEVNLTLNSEYIIQHKYIKLIIELQANLEFMNNSLMFDDLSIQLDAVKRMINSRNFRS